MTPSRAVLIFKTEEGKFAAVVEDLEREGYGAYRKLFEQDDETRSAS